jgi:tight adherence protein C
MIWAVTSLTFVLTAIVVMALFYAFADSKVRVGDRLSQLRDPNSGAVEPKFAQQQIERARGALVYLGKLFPAGQSKQTPRSSLMLIRAGFRSDDARIVIRGVKVLLPIFFVAIAFFTGIYTFSPFIVLAVAAGLGVVLPEVYIQFRISKRQKKLRRALPDALDLLVICVEVGLGLDQALMRVSEELAIVHPELSGELELVNLEMRVGKTRIEALRELARRTGLEDVKTLVAMMIQTERFGTSIAQALRVHSDELRTKRRQRAEEMSAKTSVKMVGPLVFFIFPALMVVILGPAVITLIRQLLPALK